MAIGVERYITVCHPFYKLDHNWGDTSHTIFLLQYSVIGASRYNIPIIVLAIFYNSVKITELQVKEVIIGGTAVSVITPSQIRYINHKYSKNTIIACTGSVF